MILIDVFLGILALILVVAALLGTGWTYEQSISINAPVEKVWEHINSLQALSTWNPWSSKDPDLKTAITGKDGEPGAIYSWDSLVREVGAGNQTIIEVVPMMELTSKIKFIRPFKGTADAYISISPDNGGTKATWGMVSSTPYPFNIIKLFGLIEKNMNESFTSGLTRLKELSER
jgi:hypothetical protein